MNAWWLGIGVGIVSGVIGSSFNMHTWMIGLWTIMMGAILGWPWRWWWRTC